MMSDLNQYPAEWPKVAIQVKEDAGWRCIRCGHPNERPGEHVNCDDVCDWVRHPEITRVNASWESGGWDIGLDHRGWRQRVLTVHHLDNDKQNLRWWNLAALCQVCHLIIQAKVVMDRPWSMFGHSEWFKPYVAGFYAFKYLGQDMTREQVTERLDELLALERLWPKEGLIDPEQDFTKE